MMGFDPSDVVRVRLYADVRLDPQARFVAWVVTEAEPALDRNTSFVEVASLLPRTQKVERISDAPSWCPRWAPNGRVLFFLQRHPQDGTRLAQWSPQTGAVAAVRSLPDGARAIIPSPTAEAWIVSAVAPPARSHEPRLVTRLYYKRDGVGWSLGQHTALHLVTATGQERSVTPPGWDVHSAAWSPDGRRIAFVRSSGGPEDFEDGEVYVLNLHSGALSRLETPRLHCPRALSWSPDGERLACYGNDEPAPGLDDPCTRLWMVPLVGEGDAEPVVPSFDRGAVLLRPHTATPGPVWDSDGKSLFFRYADRGSIRVGRAWIESRQVEEVGFTSGQALSFDVQGDFVAYSRSDARTPSQLLVGHVADRAPALVSDPNSWMAGVRQQLSVARWPVETPVGHLDAWIHTSAGASGAPAPTLLSLHGGPHGFVGDGFSLGHFYRYVLASRGWAVVTLNLSGSGSYGKAFAHAVRTQWGERNVVELKAVLDALIAEGIADPRRIALAGYSYGGYLAAYTVGQLDAFRAAVVGAPITDLKSFFGTSDIGPWFAPWQLDGTPDERPERYRALSPITHAPRISTPVLLLHGEADDRCPVGQSEQLFAALNALRRTVGFVRYPGADHSFASSGRPSHRIDYHARLVEWVERYTLAAD